MEDPSRLAGKLILITGAISPERGAQTSVYLAASIEVQNVTGKYFVNSRQAPFSNLSYDQATARRLWDLSRDLAGLPEGVGI